MEDVLTHGESLVDADLPKEIHIDPLLTFSILLVPVPHVWCSEAAPWSLRLCESISPDRRFTHVVIEAWLRIMG